MPRIFKVGSYIIYFWVNEGNPTEPIHVHVSRVQSPNATKICITSTRKCFLCNNNSKIPPVQLGIIMRALEARVDDIIEMWKKIFGEVRFYC